MPAIKDTPSILDKFLTFFCRDQPLSGYLCNSTPYILSWYSRISASLCEIKKYVLQVRKGVAHVSDIMIDVSSRSAEPAHHLVLNEEDLAYEEEIIRQVLTTHQARKITRIWRSALQLYCSIVVFLATGTVK
jgi:hypothetical protein